MPSFVSRVGIKKLVLIIAAIAIAGFFVYRFALRGNAGKYQFVTVTKGSIAETVSITGNTTPKTSLDLGFENGGSVAEVMKAVGDHVFPGDVIARLDTRDLATQLAQAQANVDAEEAKLRSLQAGAQPADIQASQAALDKARQDLANLYASASDAASDAYAKSNDAVRNQLSAFFSSPETNNPQLTFSVSDTQTLNDVQFRRTQASVELNAWAKDIFGISASSPSSTLAGVLHASIAHISIVKNFLESVSQALTDETGLTASTANTYHASLTAALAEANTASGNLNSISQNIASAIIGVSQLQAQLDLKVSGSTPEDIQAQQALVEQAQASAASIQVKIAKASLISPIAGVVTVQNAKVGQIAAPGATLVSIISDGDLEIDANVPETDIGKVSLNDPVSITLDAFPNETFTGKVFYIDPAQTIIQGVVDYKIKVSFDKADPRMKSGLTANLDIATQQKDNALILPQFAVLQNDQGSYVEILENGKMVQEPVTLGLRDDKGNVEIISGVSEGEQVLNIGLKQGQ